MTHNTYAWYPWYKILMPGIHDIQFLYPISTIHIIVVCLMIHNVYFWSPRCVIFRFGIHDARHLCLDPWYTIFTRNLTCSTGIYIQASQGTSTVTRATQAVNGYIYLSSMWCIQVFMNEVKLQQTQVFPFPHNFQLPFMLSGQSISPSALPLDTTWASRTCLACCTCCIAAPSAWSGPDRAAQPPTNGSRRAPRRTCSSTRACISEGRETSISQQIQDSWA